jgi:hypothetical protein
MKMNESIFCIDTTCDYHKEGFCSKFGNCQIENIKKIIYQNEDLIALRDSYHKMIDTLKKEKKELKRELRTLKRDNNG